MIKDILKLAARYGKVAVFRTNPLSLRNLYSYIDSLREAFKYKQKDYLLAVLKSYKEIALKQVSGETVIDKDASILRDSLARDEDVDLLEILENVVVTDTGLNNFYKAMNTEQWKTVVYYVQTRTIRAFDIYEAINRICLMADLQVDINREYLNAMIDTFYKDNITEATRVSLLLESVVSGDFDKVVDLVNAGVDATIFGYVPCNLAIKYGHVDITKYLKGKGTHVTNLNVHYYRKAIKKGHSQMIPLIQQLDNKFNDLLTLEGAAESGDIQTFEMVYNSLDVETIFQKDPFVSVGSIDLRQERFNHKIQCMTIKALQVKHHDMALYINQKFGLNHKVLSYFFQYYTLVELSKFLELPNVIFNNLTLFEMDELLGLAFFKRDKQSIEFLLSHPIYHNQTQMSLTLHNIIYRLFPLYDQSQGLNLDIFRYIDEHPKFEINSEIIARCLFCAIFSNDKTDETVTFLLQHPKCDISLNNYRVLTDVLKFYCDLSYERKEEYVNKILLILDAIIVDDFKRLNRSEALPPLPNLQNLLTNFAHNFECEIFLKMCLYKRFGLPDRSIQYEVGLILEGPDISIQTETGEDLILRSKVSVSAKDSFEYLCQSACNLNKMINACAQIFEAKKIERYKVEDKAVRELEHRFDKFRNDNNLDINKDEMDIVYAENDIEIETIIDDPSLIYLQNYFDRIIEASHQVNLAIKEKIRVVINLDATENIGHDVLFREFPFVQFSRAYLAPDNNTLSERRIENNLIPNI